MTTTTRPARRVDTLCIIPTHLHGVRDIGTYAISAVTYFNGHKSGTVHFVVRGHGTTGRTQKARYAR